MAQRFLGCDRDQVFLLPPSVDDWLPADHFARFVIAANRRPDHCTIARFRQRHETALAGIFGEVLALCAQAGLAGVAVLAVDGTKVHANASERATRDYEQLAREVLEQAAEIDAAEDEQFGDRRGDELPAELASAQGRQKWLAEAKRRLEAQREREARPIPASRPARVREAKRRLEEELQTECAANAAYQAYRARGVNEERPPLRVPAQALSAARAADRHDQRHRSRLAQRQDPARLGAGLQRPGGLQRAADRAGRRDLGQLGRLRSARPDDHGRRARTVSARDRDAAGRGAR
jgi:hypothetical protein